MRILIFLLALMSLGSCDLLEKSNPRCDNTFQVYVPALGDEGVFNFNTPMHPSTHDVYGVRSGADPYFITGLGKTYDCVIAVFANNTSYQVQVVTKPGIGAPFAPFDMLVTNQPRPKQYLCIDEPGVWNGPYGGEYDSVDNMNFEFLTLITSDDPNHPLNGKEGVVVFSAPIGINYR